jgi:hypothetical protein
MFRFAVDATRIVSDTDCFCVGACPQGCGIELATPIASDVVEYLQDKHIPAKELVIISQPQGTNDRAINGSQAANGLAYGIAIDPLVRRYPQVHLFLAMPMGLAILLDTVGMPWPAQPSTRISSSSDECHQVLALYPERNAEDCKCSHNGFQRFLPVASM